MFSSKSFCSVLVCVVVVQSALAITYRRHESSVKWSYENQKAWPGPSCHKGQRQSPVDIRWHTDDVKIDWDGRVIKTPLNFYNYNAFKATVENNGHTVQVTTVTNNANFGLVNGGPLGNRWYKFSSFHVHRFSEHTLDGERFPLELHIVHHRADLTPQQALNEPDGYAVIGILYKEAAVRHGSLDDLYKSVKAVRKPYTKVYHGLFNLRSLLPKNHNNYFTYNGSLTTPQCNKVVTWILMGDPQGISKKQLNEFDKVDFGTRYNYRYLQPLNGRTIYETRP